MICFLLCDKGKVEKQINYLEEQMKIALYICLKEKPKHRLNICTCANVVSVVYFICFPTCNRMPSDHYRHQQCLQKQSESLRKYQGLLYNTNQTVVTPQTYFNDGNKNKRHISKIHFQCIFLIKKIILPSLRSI